MEVTKKEGSFMSYVLYSYISLVMIVGPLTALSWEEKAGEKVDLKRLCRPLGFSIVLSLVAVICY